MKDASANRFACAAQNPDFRLAVLRSPGLRRKRTRKLATSLMSGCGGRGEHGKQLVASEAEASESSTELAGGALAVSWIEVGTPKLSVLVTLAMTR
jgi:hypothetical protein